MTTKQRKRRVRALCSGRVVAGQVVIVPASDPTVAKWQAEGSPTFEAGMWADCDVTPDYMRADYVGD